MKDYYKFIVDEDNYIRGFVLTNEDDYEFYGDINNYPDVVEGWYKLKTGKLVVDQTRKDQIIAEREAEAKKPTWQETIEAQVMWTALMTDTVVESGEE